MTVRKNSIRTVKDNDSLPGKLTLRRYMLDRYHKDNPPSVFDACQGDGLIWRELKHEYVLASYFGVDKKTKKGRMKIDSARLLDVPGFDFDVVDIDTYGMPWKHYHALCRHVTKPTTVFLTIGSVTMSLDSLAEKLIGLPEGVPMAFKAGLIPFSFDYCLTLGDAARIEIIEAVEGRKTKTVRTIALRIKPKETVKTNLCDDQSEESSGDLIQENDEKEIF